MTESMPCQQCGQPHARCSAHTRAGRPCGQKRMNGQTVCKMHGGMAPQNLAAAERRRQERVAMTALESFGIPIVIDPHTALLEELHRTAGAVAWLGAQVGDLEKDDVVWGITKTKDGGDDTGTTEEAKPNIWYELWARERKHLVEVANACVKAGIEERRIALAESQGRMLAVVVQRVLDRLELSEAQRQLVSVVVPEEFRAVAQLEAGGAA